MRTIIFVSALGCLAMFVALVYGFSSGQFWSDGQQLIRNPWGLVSLVDVYTGLLLFSVWVVYREKSTLSSLLWIAALIGLGFFAASLYTLRAALASQGNSAAFLHGARHVDAPQK